MFFRNRAEAGHRLCERLKYLQGTHLVVLGLPRGGVPVAFWVAWALDTPLDVLIVVSWACRSNRNSPWEPSVSTACASSTPPPSGQRR